MVYISLAQFANLCNFEIALYELEIALYELEIAKLHEWLDRFFAPRCYDDGIYVKDFTY